MTSSAEEFVLELPAEVWEHLEHLRVYSLWYFGEEGLDLPEAVRRVLAKGLVEVERPIKSVASLFESPTREPNAGARHSHVEHRGYYPPRHGVRPPAAPFPY